MPALLTRQGERLAMRELADDVRSELTPLFAVHPVPLDPKTGLPTMTVEEHLTKLARTLPADWGVGPAFVDLRHVDTTVAFRDGRHPLVGFVAMCRERGLLLSPVVSDIHTAAYRHAAVDAAAALGTAVGLRLGPSTWPQLGTPFGDGQLLGMLTQVGQRPEDTNLIIDLEDQVQAGLAVTAAALRAGLRALPHAFEWASVTVIGTGMPSGTAEVGRDGAAEIPRAEWLLWRSIVEEPGYRHPTFGDYGVQHPDPLSDFNPLYMDSSAQLRYTISSSWYVVRGRGVRRAGLAQIHELAAQVVAHHEYSGPDFSWGDRWISDCAGRQCTAGNQGLWRKATTNHHLTMVARQLANLRGA